MSSDVAIAIQARLKSERLPRKILASIEGRPMLMRLARRLGVVDVPDIVSHVVVACPVGEAEQLLKNGVLSVICVEGPEKDILTRLLAVADVTKCKKLVRVTGDCPLICPRMIEAMIKLSYKCGKPVVSNWSLLSRQWPNGFDLEVYDVDFLRKLSEDLKDENDREYFAQWVMSHAHSNMVEVATPGHDSQGTPVTLNQYRLTVDYPEDLELVRAVYNAMGREIWDGPMILAWLDQHPEVFNLNRRYAQETGSREENDLRKR